MLVLETKLSLKSDAQISASRIQETTKMTPRERWTVWMQTDPERCFRGIRGKWKC